MGFIEVLLLYDMDDPLSGAGHPGRAGITTARCDTIDDRHRHGHKIQEQILSISIILDDPTEHRSELEESKRHCQTGGNMDGVI